MRKLAQLGLAGLASGAMLLVGRAQQATPPAPPPFMEALSAHGDWRHEAGYGWYWRPFEADRTAGWRPYLNNGYWQWAGNAWSWTSDYVWGATVFHYGRWANVPAKGWVWIPGEDFSPAWVQWVRLEDHWGWAPLPPAPGYAEGFGLSLQMQPEDFALIPEGALNRRNLETIAVFGVRPGTPPQVVATTPVPGVVTMPGQPVPAVQAPTFVAPAPTVWVEPAPTVIYQETRYVGPTVWWDWNDSLWDRDRWHDRRNDRWNDRWDGGSHGRPSRDNPRIVPVPTPEPAPRHVPVPSRPDLGTAPIRPGTPVTPNIHRPPPTPTPSRRAQGVADILEGRR